MTSSRFHAGAAVAALGLAAWLGAGGPFEEPRSGAALAASGDAERAVASRELPTTEPGAVARRAVQDTPVVTQNQYDGWRYMMVHCARCHGETGGGSAIAPSLLDAVENQAISRDSFITVVMNGRVQKGMPAWHELLDPEQAGSIHDYIEARTEGLRAGRPKVEETAEEPAQEPAEEPAEERADEEEDELAEERAPTPQREPGEEPAEERAEDAAQDVTETMLDMMSDSEEWVHTGRTYSLQRHSELSQINTENVHHLQVSWMFSTGELRGHEGEPLVIGDTMYVHSPFPNKVFALDLSKEGSPMIWQYTPDQPEEVIPIACCDVVNRGVAYHPSGKIFIQLLDAHILALDAETGERLWKTRNGSHTEGETMTNAPLVVEDKVIVGISGGEFGVRGHVTAYDVESGERVWRAYSTGPDEDVKLCDDTFEAPYEWMQGEDLGVTSWKEPAPDEWKRGGGTTWGWYSYDPELDLFYYGTGNPGTWNPDQRPGDNLWSMTIFARDPDTGCAHWAYQMTPHDEWDYDGVNENILVDQEIDGEMRKTLVHFDRNGFAYTIDRTNGKLLVAEPYGPVNWAEGIDMETGRPIRNPEKGTSAGQNTTNICPAAMGFKDQEPASYSPDTGLFYIPANHICMNYEGVEVQYAAGQPYVGAIVEMFPGPGGHRGRLVAWDATEGEVVWENEEDVGTYGGTLTTAGGLVFYSTLDGWVKAADDESGEVLWKFKAPSGIIGNLMTYMGPDGKQHVAVLSGVGGWPGIGVAADIGPEDPTEGLGALGAWGDLARHTNKAGILLDFALP